MNNGSELIKSTAQFGIHLEGESEIDAMLLSKTISDMAELTQLAARKQNPDAYLKMNVTAFKNGSFQIDFSTVCEVAQSLSNMATPVATLALTVVGTVKGIFEIKKLLKGKKAKEVIDDTNDKSKVIIKNNNSETINVEKCSTIVFNNFRADQLASNISHYAQEHNPTGGFSFFVGSDELHCSAQDVKNMTEPLPVMEETITKKCKVEAVLDIKKADILGRSAWDFRYNGKSITAKIDDDNFLETVHNGAALKAGDYINALLEIEVRLDENGKPVCNSEQYTVISVHDGIRHFDPEQLELN